MSVPLRKDDFVEEDLTTADLAGKRPAASDLPNDNRTSDNRPGLVLAEHRSDNEVDDVRDAGVEQRFRGDVPPGVQAVTTRSVSGGANSHDSTPLFPSNEIEDLRDRWNGVQAAFVDEPRSAVEQADGLVASAMKRLAEVFAEERSKLEGQWDRGDNVSTEDLRVALQRYRSFFHRLLAV